MHPVRSLTLLALVAALGLLHAGQAARLPAAVGSQPHSISLRRNGAHICGGSLITAKVAITAAHCVSLSGGQQSYPPRSHNVRVGSIQRLAGGQLIALSQIIIHPEYSSSTAAGANDLALLELETPATLNDNTKPIDLAQSRPAAGAEVTFSGWGASVPDGSFSHALQVASRQVLSSSECQSQLFLGQEDLLCLAPAAEDADVSGLCSGDAGAPGVYNNQLVGIAAFFVGGCSSSQPDGYVDVTKHLEWIAENTA